MSTRIDRRIGNGRLFFTAFVILILVGASVYLWLRMAGKPASPDVAPTQQDTSAKALQYDEPLTITAYVPANATLGLLQVAVKRQADTQAQARRVLEAVLAADQQRAQSPVLKQMQLRAFFIDGKGTGYVDLAPGPEAGFRGSAWEELLALYSVVNTLTQNFEEIRQVRFLVDGKDALTLAGHIDCSRAFTKRMDLVLQ